MSSGGEGGFEPTQEVGKRAPDQFGARDVERGRQRLQRFDSLVGQVDQTEVRPWPDGAFAPSGVFSPEPPVSPVGQPTVRDGVENPVPPG